MRPKSLEKTSLTPPPGGRMWSYTNIAVQVSCPCHDTWRFTTTGSGGTEARVLLCHRQAEVTPPRWARPRIRCWRPFLSFSQVLRQHISQCNTNGKKRDRTCNWPSTFKGIPQETRGPGASAPSSEGWSLRRAIHLSKGNWHSWVTSDQQGQQMCTVETSSVVRLCFCFWYLQTQNHGFSIFSALATR